MQEGPCCTGKTCSEKIWSEMINLSRALRNCGAARSTATAGQHLHYPRDVVY